MRRAHFDVLSYVGRVKVVLTRTSRRENLSSDQPRTKVKYTKSRSLIFYAMLRSSSFFYCVFISYFFYRVVPPCLCFCWAFFTLFCQNISSSRVPVSSVFSTIVCTPHQSRAHLRQCAKHLSKFAKLKISYAKQQCENCDNTTRLRQKSDKTWNSFEIVITSTF